MNIIGWIVVGLLAGGLARKATGADRRGCLGTMLVGVIGGILGGVLFRLAGGSGLNGFSVWSIFVAFVGASVLLLALQVLDRR